MRVKPGNSTRGGALLLGVVAAAALVTNASGASARTPAAAGAVSVWSWPNADPYGTRDIASGINSSNVAKLKPAWTIPLKGAAGAAYGDGDNTPVFGPNGMVYVQDVSMNVYAIDSSTGKLVWKHTIPKSQQGTIGPEGVTLVNGVIYGETKNTAFALEASTGEQLWQSAVLGQKGAVAGFEMGPAISNGIDYLATPVQKNGGVVYALNTKTGKVMWKFHETQQPSSTANGGSLGNGGSWGSPVVADGSVFFGVANPYRTPLQAVQHPSKVLYNDSTVALNPQTGKLKWYMQAVPNDVYDWDMQIGPMYAASGPGGNPTVIDAGKMGYVYAMNATTGKLFWKTPVGKHNGHDNDGLLAMEHKLKLQTPYTVCPGITGGSRRRWRWPTAWSTCPSTTTARSTPTRRSRRSPNRISPIRPRAPASSRR